MRAIIRPAAPNGAVRVPPSKSAAHRAILCAALADGESLLRPVGTSDDMEATIGAMRALGASIGRDGDALRVRGIARLPDGPLHIDCIESGSTLRFLIPLCALREGGTRFTGRGRLLARPQSVYAELFAARGLGFSQSETQICVQGPLPAGEYRLRGDVSSQFITGLLLALPLLPEDSRIEVLPPFESASYVDITLQALADFGITVRREGFVFQIPGGRSYSPREYEVEGDYSQLAFFAAYGALSETGRVDCLGVRADSFQGDRAVLPILEGFGAKLEPIPGGFRFPGNPGGLRGREVDVADCPDLGPILLTVGACAKGRTTLSNAGRLRLKESDRIAAMEAELRKCGVEVTSTKDTVTVAGGLARLPETTLDCHNDHRIAMSLAVLASVRAGGPVTLEGAECVAKSYPGFFEDLRAAGADVRTEGGTGDA